MRYSRTQIVCAQVTPNGKRRFHLVIDSVLLAEVERIAQENERTITAEIRHALKEHVAKEEKAA